MHDVLNDHERRVLGVLIEKALSQPEYYPMTSNAVVAGCNQKSNRNPAMSLTESDVLATLEELRGHGVVTLVLPAPGGRSQRWKHEADKVFGWNARQQAIMAELLLRGPQTPGELRTRCARMFKFESMEALNTALQSLIEPDEGPRMVASLSREPGQSAIRYAHLLYPEGEAPATVSVSPPPALAPGVPSPSGRSDSNRPAEPPIASGADTAGLQSQIDDLNEEVAELHQTVSELTRRLDVLEGRL